jgi:NADPH:quinone reductase-like Zn-dependent oxidoreductase
VVIVGGGVTEWSKGDRVVAITETPQKGLLTADFAAIPAADLHAVPPNVSFLGAAAVMHPFATAWEALFHSGHQGLGERVVVIGGSNPAALAAVQICRWRKSRIVVVADGHRAPRLRALGADLVVSRSAPDLPRHVIAGLGGPAGLVIQVEGGPIDQSLAMLGPDGRLVVVGATEPQVVHVDLIVERRIHLIGSQAHFDTVDVDHILKLLSDGTFVPVIDSIHTFSQADRAGLRLESSDRVGSVVLVPDALSDQETARIREEG